MADYVVGSDHKRVFVFLCVAKKPPSESKSLVNVLRMSCRDKSILGDDQERYSSLVLRLEYQLDTPCSGRRTSWPPEDDVAIPRQRLFTCIDDSRDRDLLEFQCVWGRKECRHSGRTTGQTNQSFVYSSVKGNFSWRFIGREVVFISKPRAPVILVGNFEKLFGQGLDVTL